MDVFLFNTLCASGLMRFWVTHVPWSTRVGVLLSRYMLPIGTQYNYENQSSFGNEFHNHIILYGGYSPTGGILS